MRLKKTDKSGMTLTFDRPKGWDDLRPGDSVATNGICLSVAAVRDKQYDCVVVPETLAVTSFGKKLPKKVNLERAMLMTSRFDGHFVQGHVDGIGQVSAIKNNGEQRLVVSFDPKNRNLVMYKGSIAIDGVALTVASVEDNNLTVALIPHTLKRTTLPSLKLGDSVNLEFDILGKYVVNSLNNRIVPQSKLDKPNYAIKLGYLKQRGWTYKPECGFEVQQ